MKQKQSIYYFNFSIANKPQRSCHNFNDMISSQLADSFDIFFNGTAAEDFTKH
jgi:hypothetical protein